MSITDELREWVRDHTVSCSDNRIALVAIAERIDAEYQKAEDEWKAKDGQSWLRGYAECHAELMEGNEVIAADLEKAGWVKLPLDADGVPIHVGDVMEWCDPDGEVTVTCEVDAVGVECFFAWDGANGRYAQKCANDYRHHRPPTVEDILKEFASDIADVLGGDDFRLEDNDELFAEYAAKLRLAGDGE